MIDALVDKHFLFELDQQNQKYVYAKVISLDMNENPVEEITGRVQSENINVDGDSTVRRSCSLQLITDELKIHDYYWGLKTKIKVMIGVENRINDKYPDIIWFKMGTFVISYFNTSQNLNTYTVNIQGKDKMTLLNGEMGGVIHALNHDFGRLDLTDEYGVTTKLDYPIRYIVRDLVNEFAHEPLKNIIINDLDDYGLWLLEYRGESPMYIIFDNESDEPLFTTFVDDYGLNLRPVDGGKTISIAAIDGVNYKFAVLNRLDMANEEGSVFLLDNNRKVRIAKIEQGEIPGYTMTEITYAGDLIANVGEFATSILDKICQQLGNFEYFYDIDGRFIFQRKKIYINALQNTLLESEYQENTELLSNIYYSFENNFLVSQFSNQPDFANLKNDFSIWGERKDANGGTWPLHLRYAIDRKPTKYVSYSGKIYTADKYDWRELIYQMALDFRKYRLEDDFYQKIEANNYDTENDINVFPNGVTKYEQYYIDLEGFWRDIYFPYVDNEYYDNGSIKRKVEVNEDNGLVTVYECQRQEVIDNDNLIINDTKVYHLDTGFNILVDTPSMLKFWFDFMNTDGIMDKYAADTIGDRPKAVNDTEVNFITTREIPTIIFKDALLNDVIDEDDKLGYTFVNVPAGLTTNSAFFEHSYSKKSTQDLLIEWLDKFAFVGETVQLNTIPIYHLEPNNRILIKDDVSGVNGEYILKKYSLNLGVSGQMSITASIAPDSIY